MSDETNPRIDVIFCAIDFSDTAALALTYGARLARRHGAAIVLGHVVESLPIVPYPTLELPPEGGLELSRWASEKLNHEAEILQKAGLNVSVAIEDGRPGAKLIEMADAANASLFVIGTRGLSVIEHLILGSNAEHIIRRSPIPVLTVHPGDSPLQDNVDTVVIPTDLGPDVVQAAETFAKFVDLDPRPRAFVVFADSAPPYFEPFRHEMLAKWKRLDEGKDEIGMKMEPALEKLRNAGFEIEAAVIDGNPVQAVTQFAAEQNADMILMSTHGRSALTNFLTGKTAQRIVQHAPCPVLTVHSARKKE